MPEADFKRSILEAIQRAKGKGQLSDDFKEKVESQWSSFVQTNPAQQRDTASQE